MANMNNKLSAYENIRNAIIGKRLGMHEIEAGRVFNTLPKDLAKLLSIQEVTIKVDTEIAGRNMDILFTINKQNKPKTNND